MKRQFSLLMVIMLVLMSVTPISAAQYIYYGVGDINVQVGDILSVPDAVYDDVYGGYSWIAPTGFSLEDLLGNANGTTITEAVYGESGGGYAIIDVPETPGEYKLYQTNGSGGVDESTGSIIVSALTPTYTVSFYVYDDDAAIENAVITIGGQTIYTDGYGEATIQLANDSYEFSVTKDGYDPVDGMVLVDGEDVQVDVHLVPTSTGPELQLGPDPITVDISNPYADMTLIHTESGDDIVAAWVEGMSLAGLELHYPRVDGAAAKLAVFITSEGQLEFARWDSGQKEAITDEEVGIYKLKIKYNDMYSNEITVNVTNNAGTDPGTAPVSLLLGPDPMVVRISDPYIDIALMHTESGEDIAAALRDGTITDYELIAYYSRISSGAGSLSVFITPEGQLEFAHWNNVEGRKEALTTEEVGTYKLELEFNGMRSNEVTVYIINNSGTEPGTDPGTDLVSVTGVTVTPTTLSLKVGNTSQLTATVAPANATDKTVTWSSSNPDVASVSVTGLVTAVAKGTATIMAKTADGDFTAASTVTVTSSSSGGGSSSGGSSSGGGGGGTSATPATNGTTTNADSALSGAVQGRTATIELIGSNRTAEVSASTLHETLNKGTAVVVNAGSVSMNFGTESLLTDALTSALKENGAQVLLGANVVPAKEAQELMNNQSVQRAGLISIGGKVIDLVAQIKTASGSVQEIGTFKEPVAVTIDLSDVTLSEADLEKVTAVRLVSNADGTVTTVKMGGKYDAATKKFTFYTDHFSKYSVMKAEKLTKLTLSIGNKVSTRNGAMIENDVAPMVMNSRTIVPVRFIAENLGAAVGWDEATRTVTIDMNGEVLAMVIDAPLSGFDVNPTIIDNRTMVPLRYVSEKLGAFVLWHPDTKSIDIVQ